jgi:transposase InsO family protein
MTWKAVSVMEQRHELVRLAMMEGANRRELFRRFGVSPETGYKWIGRAVGGSDFADQSRKPLSSPLRCSDAIEHAVLTLRDQHPAWGARKLEAVLVRQGFAMPAVSTIHSILVRHHRIYPKRGGEPAHLRFERPEPNELWQMDFKGASGLSNGERLHPLTVIDDHSRYCICLAACGNERETTVKNRLTEVFCQHGLPQAFFVDNGHPWGDTGGGKWTAFRVWLLKLGVQLIHARPYHPQSRGKNERFHRAMDDEVFAMRPLANIQEAQQAFTKWRTCYNHERPHEGIGMQCPGERYRPSPRTMPQTLQQPEYGEAEIIRKVPADHPRISFKGRLWRLPKSFRNEHIAIRPHNTDGIYGLYFGAHIIKTIDLNEKRD